MTFTTPISSAGHHGTQTSQERLSPEECRGRCRRSKLDMTVYYTVFGTLFVISFAAFLGAAVIGRSPQGGVYEAAKRAASGPAGYAVNC
ncbi:MAG: hypothetical protein AAF221_00730 [Pseudomonadota bacterium]